MEINWTPITEEYPPLNEDVIFCCQIDDAFTLADKGRYRGFKTFDDTLVMEAEGDWSPCSHWMPMIPTPDSMTTNKIMRESPEMRERGVQRLLAAIDAAILNKQLNPRSQIADARLDLGGVMDDN